MENQQERLAARAYLAGIIDGEGWVGFSMHKRKNGMAITPIIAVHMVGPPTIEHLNDICTIAGLPSYIQHNRDGTSRWTVSGMKRVVRVIESVRPFLFVKSRQADLVLEFIESRQDKYGKPATEREIQIREEVKSLNVKGKGKNPQRLYAKQD